MALENRLGITDSIELARAEERISKGKALELFESGQFSTLRVGSVDAQLAIHVYSCVNSSYVIMSPIKLVGEKQKSTEVI